MRNVKTTSISMPRPLLKRLQIYAIKRNMSVSSVLTQMVAEMFNELDEGQKTEKQEAP